MILKRLKKIEPKSSDISAKEAKNFITEPNM